MKIKSALHFIWAFLVLLVTCLGLIGDEFWVFHLFEHFRFQYLWIGALGLLSSLAFAPKLWIFGPWVLSLALNFWILRGHLLPEITAPGVVSSNGQSLSLISINILTSNTFKKELVSEIKRLRPDVVALQEVDKSWMKMLSELDSLYPHKILHHDSSNFGMAIYSKHPMEWSKKEELHGGVYLKIKVKGVVIFNIHTFPPFGRFGFKQNLQQIQGLGPLAQELKGSPSLFVGDFNQTPWSNRMQDFLQSSELSPAFFKFGYRSTWPSHFWAPFRIKIDHVFHSSQLRPVELMSLNVLGSDHLGMWAKFEL